MPRLWRTGYCVFNPKDIGFHWRFNCRVGLAEVDVARMGMLWPVDFKGESPVSEEADEPGEGDHFI